MAMLFAMTSATSSHADTIADTITLSSIAPDVLFDWDTQRCDENDIPDAPPRVFRDSRKTLHLFATHDRNRAMLGKDFDSLRHDCRVVFEGAHADDPERYNDREWLASFYALDGRRIYSLIHNEYHGYLRPKICPSKDYGKCWENSIVAAVSTDDGNHFKRLAQPVAALPYPYRGDIGHPVGYFQPTNIVQVDGYFYVVFNTTPYRDQKGGLCVARTASLSGSPLWRAWDGKNFSAIIAGVGEIQPSPKAICEPLKGQFFELGSLVYDPVSKNFLLLTSISPQQATTNLPAGVYVSQSLDVLQWGPPHLVASEDSLRLGADAQRYHFGFYSVVDHRSRSRSFDQLADGTELYLYYVRGDDQRAPLARQLCRRRLVLTRNSVASGGMQTVH